jgi:hypothetical protein
MRRLNVERWGDFIDDRMRLEELEDIMMECCKSYCVPA